MITEIKSIHGVGRYGNCDMSVPLKKNQIVFGFNGTGKSTLSDIFYSMSSTKPDLINDRKTLPLANGTLPQDIFISFDTENGEVSFFHGAWSNAGKTYVFNDHYIDEYLFVENGHNIESGTVIFGKEGTILAQKKQQLQIELESNIEKINAIIIARKELCGNLEIGKTKLRNTGWEKRIQKIAAIKLYNASQRQKIDLALSKLIAYDERIQLISKWHELLLGGLDMWIQNI